MYKNYKKMDKPLLFLTIVFCLFGLIMIFSASSVSTVLRYHEPPYYFFAKQAIFLFVATLFGVFVILNIKTSRYKGLSWFGLLAIIFLLAMLFLKGKIIGGAQSWFDLGFMSFQPSEFAKSILIIFMACYYDSLSKKNINNFYAYLIPLAFALIIAVLVMMQPDMGSAFIILGIVFMTFISVPMVKQNAMKFIKILAFGLVIVVIYFLYSGSNLLNSNQLNRLNFKNPCARYTESTGYQVCNGLIAMKNGGLFGVGLGNSTQKYLYLPESHTDFIFPVIVEELGFVTGVLVIILYAVVLYRILRIAKSSETLRCSIIAYGTFWYLTMHILVNLLGILDLIPLTGVPLPFLSYGGCYTLNVITMLFLVQRCNIENETIKVHREIKSL
jgi:cell division protein FtsW